MAAYSTGSHLHRTGAAQVFDSANRPAARPYLSFASSLPGGVPSLAQIAAPPPPRPPPPPPPPAPLLLALLLALLMLPSLLRDQLQAHRRVLLLPPLLWRVHLRHLPLHGVTGQQVGGIASDWHRQSLWATGASATTAASAQQSCCESSADTSCMPGHEAAQVLWSSARPTLIVTVPSAVSSPCDRTSPPSPSMQTHAVPTPHAAVHLMQRPESSSPGAATRPQWRLAAWRQPHRPALLVPAVAALSRLRRPWRPLLHSGDGQQLPRCCKPAHPFTHRKCCKHGEPL